MAEIKILRDDEATITLNRDEVAAVNKALKELKSSNANVLNVQRVFDTLHFAMKG